MTTDSDYRLRHLEMIQAVVNRFAQNSFAIKGWSVTVVSIVFAFLNAQGKAAHSYGLLAVVPTWIFWGMDAYYLRQERLYRKLFAASATGIDDGSSSVPLFEMTASRYQDLVASWRRTLAAPSVAAIPLMLTSVILGIWLLRTLV